MATGISVRLLQKDFPLVTGRTVIDELLDEKLLHVKNMLVKTSTPLDVIARMCGFSSPTHLMTTFRKRFGMTMTAYRSRGR